MFITSKYSGYNRHGEQVAAGLFLILTEPHPSSKQFPMMSDTCSDCGQSRDAHYDAQGNTMPDATCKYFRPSYINYPVKAIVRHTSLGAFGNFMMGSARVHGHRVVLSGSYGGDGLPCHVPDEVYQNYGIKLPAELYNAWKDGGGWNSAGSEASAMRKWAIENITELRK